MTSTAVPSPQKEKEEEVFQVKYHDGYGDCIHFIAPKQGFMPCTKWRGSEWLKEGKQLGQRWLAPAGNVDELQHSQLQRSVGSSLQFSPQN